MQLTLQIPNELARNAQLNGVDLSAFFIEALKERLKKTTSESKTDITNEKMEAAIKAFGLYTQSARNSITDPAFRIQYAAWPPKPDEFADREEENFTLAMLENPIFPPENPNQPRELKPLFHSPYQMATDFNDPMVLPGFEI